MREKMLVQNVAGVAKEIKKRDDFIRTWHPLNAVMVASDENSRFLLPSEHPWISDSIFHNYKRNQTIRLRLLAATMVGIFIVSQFLTKIPDNHVFWMTSLFMMASLVFDSWQCGRKTEYVNQRAQIYFEAIRDGKKLCFFAFLSCSVIYTTQIYLQYRVGSFDNLVIMYGCKYSMILEHEYWRFFSGPFIHASFGHWSINSCLLIMLLALAYSQHKWATIILVLMALPISHVGAFLSHIVSNSDTDSIVGMSGGVYALLAFTTAYNFFQRRMSSFAITLLLMTLTLAIGSKLLHPNVSNIAHLSGYLTGLISYLIMHMYHSQSSAGKTS